MTTGERTFSTRFRERLKYGLMAQEALDRLSRTGLVYYPYYIVREGAHAVPDTPDDAASLRFARLASQDAALVAALPCRPRDAERVLDLMTTTACFGVFDGTDLVGYSWADFRALQAPLTSRVLFELGENGACLRDMYIARSHRGRRLAPWLRYRVYHALAAEGRHTLYSITLAHNRSSRRFKERLGAVEIEKRIIFGLRAVGVYDTRSKALVSDRLPTPKAFGFRGKLA